MTNLGLASTKPLQTIEFPINGGEETAAVFAENVIIIPSSGDHKNGSSKVKLSNVVDYSWEEKFYSGQLLAVHMGGNYIAYSIKGANYAVRVVNRETGRRALIKGIGAMVEDLEFAFIPNQITLACVDETGSVYIHNIHEDSNEITTSLLLHIIQNGEVNVPRRVFWCPFIPDEDTELQQQDPYNDETSLLLAVTRDNKIEVWNIASAASLGSGPVRSDTVAGACVSIAAHESTIVHAAFSPDGTAIATASIDGECNFFQVYMQSEGEPTCLHRWKPHNGKPVTSLFFLDDQKSANPEVKFWKFAVTGTDDNCELKLWTCETWKCLQTIRFCSKGSRKHSKLKTSVDLSAGYLFVSDMVRKVLFILELEKHNNESIPFVKTATEFMFPCPILSFGIVEAGPQVINRENPIFSMEDLTNGDDDENQTAVIIRMFLVQPKSLQECTIVFQTNSPVTQNYGSNGLDELSELLVETPTPQQPSLNLMTPDAFNSSHIAESTPIILRNNVSQMPEVNVAYTGNMIMANGEPPIDNRGSDRKRGGGCVSGGSSPSREVEEILSSPRYYSSETTSNLKPQSHNKKSVEMYEKLKCLESTLQTLHSEVASLTHAVSSQTSIIQSLQEEVRRTRGTSISEVQGAITSAVSTYKPVSEQDIVSAITPLISQAILTVINPAVVTSMTELNSMVQHEVASKLNSTDCIIKENLTKLVTSKAFIEMIMKSLSIAVTTTMEPVFRESFSNIVIPQFEVACKDMVHQINDSFSRDMNEALNVQSDRANLEILTLRSVSDKINQVALDFSSTVSKESKGLEDTMIEVEKRLKACVNGASVRSGSVTPAQHLVDPHLIQNQISALLRQGQYNAAFQQALSASDLNMVAYVCEKVDTSKIFSGASCVLQQHVLLSLIQQLAADMSSHTDLKLRYLEAAVMYLLPDNENTREHMPQVLSVLQKQLHMFKSSSSDPHLAKKAKLLALACTQMVQNLDWIN